MMYRQTDVYRTDRIETNRCLQSKSESIYSIDRQIDIYDYIDTDIYDV